MAVVAIFVFIVAYVFLPFLTPLVLAGAVSVIIYPVYRFLRGEHPKNLRKNLSAFITVLVAVVLIVVPSFLLVSNMYSETQTLYGLLTDEQNRGEVITLLNDTSQKLSDLAFGAFPAYSFDSLNLTEYIKSALEWTFSNLDSVFTGIAHVVAYVVVFLLALFYFLRDGKELKRRLLNWNSVLENNEVFITRTVVRSIRSVFAGSIAVSIIDGILIGLGLLVFGIPAPSLWGTIAAVAALIPSLGTSLVILPSVGYLLLTHNYAYAVGLFVWCYLAVFIVDHTFGPYLMNRGMKIHPFLILLSVLGGIILFGPIGLFLGPVILAIMIALIEVYRVTFANKK
jgi:predicted PurR-regulated permease PerM